MECYDNMNDVRKRLKKIKRNKSYSTSYDTKSKLPIIESIIRSNVKNILLSR